jgi:hypothetical protein
MSEREHAHQLIDRLPDTQLSALVGLLETIVDPLAAALRNAPTDDEPLTPEEAAAIEQGIASLDRNGGVPMDEVLAGFGLTSEQFQKIVEQK